jgi:integrase
MTLTRYCEPIRATPVDAIDTEAVFSILKPLWARAPETASRLRGRIEAVLDAARARGHIARNEANPARWRGHLDKLLPKRPKLTRGRHAAMPYADVPAFVAALRERPAIAARSLEFCILTATRSGETLAARWDEIDFDGRVWRVPPERTKAGREHRVPLSERAIAILREMQGAGTDDYVFPGQRTGRPLSNMAFEMLLRRIGSPYTAHGFRSSFRDWAGNETHFPREVAEHALAHVIGDKAEQAYQAIRRPRAAARIDERLVELLRTRRERQRTNAQATGFPMTLIAEAWSGARKTFRGRAARVNATFLNQNNRLCQYRSTTSWPREILRAENRRSY